MGCAVAFRDASHGHCVSGDHCPARTGLRRFGRPGCTRGVAPSRRDDRQVRAVRSATGRFVPIGLDLRRRFWRSGKATADSDIVEARYVDIVPEVRVVQAVDFVSDEPAFASTMTMTWEVTAVDGGSANTFAVPG